MQYWCIFNQERRTFESWVTAGSRVSASSEPPFAGLDGGRAEVAAIAMTFDQVKLTCAPLEAAGMSSRPCNTTAWPILYQSGV